MDTLSSEAAVDPSADAKPAKRTRSEAARLKGLALKAKMAQIDPDYYARISRQGGEAIRDGYSTAYLEVLGMRGGETTKGRRGSEHYARISGRAKAGRKGGKVSQARQRAKRATEAQHQS